MAELLKRGRVWYSNFAVKVYDTDGTAVRKPNGDLAYTKIRWALHGDKEEATKEQSKLLDIRRAADAKDISFHVQYQSTRAKEKGELYATWRDSHLKKRETGFKPDTYDHDERAFREFDKALAKLTPPAKVTVLEDITPRLLDRVVTQWLADKKPPAALNRALRAIKQAVREAAGFGEMPQHDWTVVKKVKGENEHRTHFFTREEVKTQLKEMPGHYKTLAYLGNRGGRRISEVYYLQWKGVDFRANTIQNDRIPGAWAPKSKKSYGPVPMKSDLREYLLKLKKVATDDWVIPRARINKTAKSMGHYFKRLLRRMHIKNGSAHTCRHTFASHMVQEGVDIYAVMKLMRHASIKETEKYTHLRPPDLQASVDRLPDV